MAWDQAIDECALLDAVGADVDEKSFLAGESSPWFVGSAVTNFGVRHLLDAIVELAPPPGPRADTNGAARLIGAPFAAQVFKIHANMDPAHRDHVAFVRICSGRFDRGMVVTHGPSGRPFATKYAAAVFGSERDTIDTAFPEDVVGLVNAGGLRIGDTIYADEPVEFPPLPTFAPELFAAARPCDVSRHKQFHRGVVQLEREGVVQVLRSLDGDPVPVLGAVGGMQLEVLEYRMADEFGAPVALTSLPFKLARRTDKATAAALQRTRGARVLKATDGTLLALLESPWLAQRLEADHPGWTLEHLVAG